METPAMAAPSALAPVFQEILAALRSLVETDARHSIDLRTLPLAPGDDERLETFLGRGEVHAEMQSLGRSEFIESRFSGVWLVNHFNADDQLVGRLIEIARVPELLLPPAGDLDDSLTALASALAAETPGAAQTSEPSNSSH